MPSVLQAYKAAAIELVKEYMASSDIAEVAEALKELGQPEMQHIFVKQVRGRLQATALPGRFTTSMRALYGTTRPNNQTMLLSRVLTRVKGAQPLSSHCPRYPRDNMLWRLVLSKWLNKFPIM